MKDKQETLADIIKQTELNLMVSTTENFEKIQEEALRQMVKSYATLQSRKASLAVMIKDTEGLIKHLKQRVNRYWILSDPDTDEGRFWFKHYSYEKNILSSAEKDLRKYVSWQKDIKLQMKSVSSGISFWAKLNSEKQG